jgi:hypothetical protein
MVFAILHSFVNLFAGGRSDSKTIIFPIYILALVFLIRFKKNIFTRISLWWGIISLAGLYLYGFVSHILLFHYYNLPLTSFTITGSNGEISSTTLSHTHEAKGVIGFILAKFDIIQLQNTDAGGAYLHLISSWWFVVGAILLAASISFAAFYINKFSKYYSTENIWKNVFFIIWYAIVSFSLVKTAIDGGILTPSLLSIIASIYLFGYMQKQKDARIPLLIIFITSLIGFAGVLVFPDWSGAIVLMQSLGTLLVLTTLSLGIFGAPKNIYILISVLLLLISWWMASSRDQEIFKYGQISIEKGEVYFSYDTQTHSIVKTISEHNILLKNIVKSEHKNLSYAPISVPGKTCSEGSLPQVVDVLIKTREPIQTIKSNYLDIFVKDQKYEKLWWDNDVSIVMKPCSPEALTVIDDTLKQHKFDFYVMVNPLFHDEFITQ